MNSSFASFLEISHLSVSFSGHTVLHDISLSLPSGGIAVLAGRSGSGKTTLLRSINRLNEELPGCHTHGSIRLTLRGKTLDILPEGHSSLPLAELRRRIGMVFQTPQVFPVSVYRNIALPLSVVMNCPKQEIEGRVQSALQKVDLWQEVKDRLSMGADRLSGGQQQRLCIARALAMEPDVLLLDEPTRGIDVGVKAAMYQLMMELKKQGKSIIMISEELLELIGMSDRMVLLKDGV
ncbi:MAG: phosphate ABC transporter ATP-binding protein, partial [Mailhella sp.]